MTVPEKSSQTLTPFRLRRHADYQRAYAGARKKQSPSMSWFVALREARPANRHAPVIEDLTVPRVGLTVGKVIGPAHERNRIKRRLRDILRRHTAELPVGCDLILHPRRSVLKIEATKLESEVLRMLSDAGREREKLLAAKAASV